MWQVCWTLCGIAMYISCLTMSSVIYCLLWSKPSSLAPVIFFTHIVFLDMQKLFANLVVVWSIMLWSSDKLYYRKEVG